MEFTYGSLFAGMGGFDLGLDRAGWKCTWQVEIDRDARRVLDHHWPAVPKHGDIHAVGARNLSRVDLICGGSPCQSFSKAGKRDGLANTAKSGLFFQMARVVEELRPAFVLWENVVGVLSGSDEEPCDGEEEEESDQQQPTGQSAESAVGGGPTLPNPGRPVPWLESIFGEFRRLGYCGVWRTVDARHFGVPQRRRRVFGLFASGHSGVARGLAGQKPAQIERRLLELLVWVLLESPGLSGYPAPRQGKKPAASPRPGGGSDCQGGATGRGVSHRSGAAVYGGAAPVARQEACALTSHPSRADFDSENFVAQAIPDMVQSLQAHSRRHGHAMTTQQAAEGGQLLPVCVTGVTTHALTCVGCDASEDGTGRGTPIVTQPIGFYSTGGTHGISAGEVPSPALKVGSGVGIPSPPAVAYPVTFADVAGSLLASGGRRNGCSEVQSGHIVACHLHDSAHVVAKRHNMGGADGGVHEDGTTPACTVNTQPAIAMSKPVMMVRRLTPIECLRLMAFADTHLDLDPPLSDSAKYRLCGNAVVVNKVAWIAARLKRAVEHLQQTRQSSGDD